ncbi:deoxyribonuclease [Arthrobacter sp. MYb213]|nr:deoxyribonuclease [Arthrobacter sp. MYb213]
MPEVSADVVKPAEIVIRTEAPPIIVRTEAPTVAPEAPKTEPDLPSASVLSKPHAPKAKKNSATSGALGLLDEIPVKGRAPKTGYDRDLFGSGWGDPDRNGCDARNDILDRDLDVHTYKAGTRECVVLTGNLLDPFTGKTIEFQRGQGTSNAVQIDHVVALSDAWQKGAQQLSPERRVAFSNDPLNLLAVDGPTNASKGDSDAATWLPPNRGYWCEYVTHQVEVKHKYDLWMTKAEHRASQQVLSDKCK